MSDINKPIIGITTDLNEKENSIESAYSRAIEEHGGVPVLIPTVEGSTDFVKKIVQFLNGLLIPGSRDMDPEFYNQKPISKINPMNRERTVMEYKTLEESLKAEIPVLGICGGMQFINVYYGGSLYQDINKYLPEAIDHEKGAVHKIKIVENTRLSDISAVKEADVNSYHHQAVKDIGKGLTVCARTEDDIVESIQSGSDNLLAVQWHPELENSELSNSVFDDFILRAKKNHS